jgi:RHS repeat-associated protein
VDGLLIGTGTLPPTDDPPDSLSRALDSNLKFTVTSDDDGDWYSTSYPYYYDGDALGSTEVSDGEYASLQTIVEVDVNEQETISFYWKVSSEENHDYLKFYIDNQLQDRISGEVDWEKKTYDINEPGPHILKWRYIKDEDDPNNPDFEDRGWVDFVKWTGSSPLQPPEDWDTITYKYDASGRRIEKEFDNDYRVKYIYDGGNVIAEYDGVNNLVRKYVHGAGVDEPVCMIDVADSNETYYYHFNGLGSVVALSDSEGETVQLYGYSVYGQVLASDPNFTTNPYMFTGRRFDIETGLYYYRTRYYNPHIGRFMQTDPVGYGDGINWYSYCGNNPLGRVDPSGLWASYSYNWVMVDDAGACLLQVLCWHDAEQTELGMDFYFMSWADLWDYAEAGGDFCDLNLDVEDFYSWANDAEINDPGRPRVTRSGEKKYMAGAMVITVASPIPGDEVLTGIGIGLALTLMSNNARRTSKDMSIPIDIVIPMKTRPGASLPKEAEPGSSQTEVRGNGGTTTRHYGPDGKPDYDVDTGHDYEGVGDPHKHRCIHGHRGPAEPVS